MLALSPFRFLPFPRSPRPNHFYPLSYLAGKFAIDKPAAARFINNALASGQRNVATPTPPTEIGMQTRFNVLKHQEAALRDEDGSEDDSEDSEDENEKGSSLIGRLDTRLPVP